MQLIWWKVIIFVSFLAEAIVFGFLPRAVLQRISIVLQKRILGISNAFAGGLFLAAGFVHLLAESTELLANAFETDFPFGMILCSLGFLFAFFFEKVFFAQYHHHDHGDIEYHESHHNSFNEKYKEKSPLIHEEQYTYSGDANSGTINRTISGQIPIRKSSDSSSSDDEKEGHDHHLGNSFAPYILMIVLSLHSLISGVAVGVQESEDEMWPLVIAIVAHKWVEAFAVGVSIMRLKVKKWKYAVLIAIYSIMEPLGVAIGTILSLVLNSTDTTMIEAIVGAVASGTFIYVATIDILVEEFARDSDKYLKTFCCLVGFGLMVALTTAFDHDHGDVDVKHHH